MEYTKTKLINTMRAQLAVNPTKCRDALMVIYSYQTSQEHAHAAVIEHNNVGFTMFDAEILTSLAQQYIRRNYLSEKQLNLLQRLMPKYSRQLVEHSIREGKIVKSGRKYVVARG